MESKEKNIEPEWQGNQGLGPISLQNFECDGIEIIKPPELSDWVAYVNGIEYRPHQGFHPNFFHRVMQRLCFGVWWRRDAMEQPNDH